MSTPRFPSSLMASSSSSDFSSSMASSKSNFACCDLNSVSFYLTICCFSLINSFFVAVWDPYSLFSRFFWLIASFILIASAYLLIIACS
jgi:hypothetical protein